LQEAYRQETIQEDFFAVPFHYMEMAKIIIEAYAYLFSVSSCVSHVICSEISNDFA
jgi:hypothetical protein